MVDVEMLAVCPAKSLAVTVMKCEPRSPEVGIQEKLPVGEIRPEFTEPPTKASLTENFGLMKLEAVTEKVRTWPTTKFGEDKGLMEIVAITGAETTIV